MDIGSMFDAASSDKKSSSNTERKMDTVPDGAYDAEVTEFSVFVSNAGDYYVKWWFEVDVGPYKGAQLQRFTGLSPKTFGFVKETIRKVTGSVPEWGSMFADGRTGPIRRDIVGQRVQVSQKTSKRGDRSYVNIYVDKVLVDAAAQPAAVNNEPAIDDDIPF